MPYTFKMLAKHLFMWEVQDSNKVQFLHTLFSEKSCLVGKANRKAFGEFHTSEIPTFHFFQFLMGEDFHCRIHFIAPFFKNLTLQKYSVLFGKMSRKYHVYSPIC